MINLLYLEHPWLMSFNVRSPLRNLLHKSYYVVKGNKIEELLIRGTTRIVLWSFAIHTVSQYFP